MIKVAFVVGSPGRTPAPGGAKWLIPPKAGLYQLSCLKKPAYASFLDLFFQDGSLTAIPALYGMDQFPWSLESLSGLGEVIVGIVVLPKPTFRVA